VPDPNVALAYAFAQGVCPPVALPPSMADAQARARFVIAVNRPFGGEVFPADPLALLEAVGFASGGSTRAFIERGAPLVPDVPDPIERLNVVLRLWCGCLRAAKEIADATLDGPNTAEGRRDRFPAIDEAARHDPIFEAGVEAAPTFKDELGEHYSLDGVPDDSPVRRYVQ
jgi:hypothetical protein